MLDEVKLEIILNKGKIKQIIRQRTGSQKYYFLCVYLLYIYSKLISPYKMCTHHDSK